MESRAELNFHPLLLPETGILVLFAADTLVDVVELVATATEAGTALPLGILLNSEMRTVEGDAEEEEEDDEDDEDDEEGCTTL